MKVMIVLNDAPYGSEKAYNALRLARALQKQQPDMELRIFLLENGAFCALPDQAPPQGFYNAGEMLQRIIAGGAAVEACATCAEARGLKNIPLIEGVKVTSIRRMAEWTADSDRIITF
jgi:uncharacterized protein involved in oxidation of intracellular sulfur